MQIEELYVRLSSQKGLNLSYALHTFTNCVTWMHRHTYAHRHPNKSVWHWCELFAICICIYITFPSNAIRISAFAFITLSPIRIERSESLASLRAAQLSESGTCTSRLEERKIPFEFVQLCSTVFILRPTPFGMCEYAVRLSQTHYLSAQSAKYPAELAEKWKQPMLLHHCALHNLYPEMDYCLLAHHFTQDTHRNSLARVNRKSIKYTPFSCLARYDL